jgi:hypothetical protein
MGWRGVERALYAWWKRHLENLRLRQHVHGLMVMLLLLLLLLLLLRS